MSHSEQRAWSLLAGRRIFPSEAEDFRKKNETCRRASTMQILSFLAAQELASMIDPNTDILIVRTFFGEVESTLSFLHSIQTTDLARPILFQNSQHNATLGWTSEKLHWTGPGFTFIAKLESERNSTNFSPEKLLELADSLPLDCQRALIIEVDFIPEPVRTIYQELISDTDLSNHWNSTWGAGQGHLMARNTSGTTL